MLKIIPIARFVCERERERERLFCALNFEMYKFLKSCMYT